MHICLWYTATEALFSSLLLSSPPPALLLKPSSGPTESSCSPLPAGNQFFSFTITEELRRGRMFDNRQLVTQTKD